jgi:uncharacterized membrane protein
MGFSPQTYRYAGISHIAFGLILIIVGLVLGLIFQIHFVKDNGDSDYNKYSIIVFVIGIIWGLALVIVGAFLLWKGKRAL